eukprot:TRINITY_DN6698_c0_g2_i1.p1 TRINITY_DN6698_c0_g2~~TRINITY_DN6698_c0_g2_i1.p1  ORF type:complete len:176 (-),score=9.14 TRINITY_DN6698_c0_g2_i1:566-1093(-)
MSLCTWATVVSTVPSQSLEPASSEESCANNNKTVSEPVPLPIFISFLELLEKMNREDQENTVGDFFCPENFSGSASPEEQGATDSEDPADGFDVDSFLNIDIYDSEADGTQYSQCQQLASRSPAADTNQHQGQLLEIAESSPVDSVIGLSPGSPVFENLEQLFPTDEFPCLYRRL